MPPTQAVLARLDNAERPGRKCWKPPEETLQESIGQVYGMFAESTRRAFVLPVLGELIHHGAEAAALRDLYAATPR